MSNNPISEIYTGVKEVQEYLEEINYENKSNIDYLSDYYRIGIDNNKCVFDVNLPEYVNKYMNLQYHTNILEIAEEHDIKSYIIRDIMKYYYEFSYLNGYKKENSSYEIVDLTDYNEDESKMLIQRCNKLINSEKYTTQQIYTILKLVYKMYNLEDRIESIENISKVFESLSIEIEHMYDYFEPETKMEWNKFGSSLKFTYDELHHKTLKESERAKVIRKIKNGEININES